MLIASDREESGDGPVKSSARKIFHFAGYQFQLAIATAGDGCLADKAVRRILACAGAAKFRDHHEQIVEDTLREVYAKYVWPAEERDSDRQFELIIGICNVANQQQLLYRSVEEILWPQTGFAVAGSGEQLATCFLERLYEDTLTIQEAMRLMGFVCRETKNATSGCGLETEMVALATEAGPTRTLAADSEHSTPSRILERILETSICGRSFQRTRGKSKINPSRWRFERNDGLAVRSCSSLEGLFVENFANRYADRI